MQVGSFLPKDRLHKTSYTLLLGVNLGPYRPHTRLDLVRYDSFYSVSGKAHALEAFLRHAAPIHDEVQ